MVKISQKEGFRSLWSGLSPTLVLAVPATIVYFVSYEQLRIYLKVNIITLLCALASHELVQGFKFF